MGRISAYSYGNRYSRAKVHKGEREIEKHRKEMREQQAVQKLQQPKPTVMLGGVEILKDQILDYHTYKLKGASVFSIKLRNGMTVEYMDQHNSHMPSNRFNAPGRISANGPDVTLYNIINGSVAGTEKSENIKLYICQNVNVDGNGGNDTYFSSQDREYSNNSYRMHLGDYYEKEDFKGYGNLDLRDFVDHENSTLYADEDYSFRDNEEHRKEFLGKENEFYAVTHKNTQDQRYKNFFLDITKSPKFTSVDEIKDDVNKKHYESLKQRAGEKLLEAIANWDEDLIQTLIESSPRNINIKAILSQATRYLEEMESEGDSESRD